MTIETKDSTKKSSRSSAMERWLQESNRDDPWDSLTLGRSKKKLRKEAGTANEPDKRADEDDISTRLPRSTTPAIDSYIGTSRPLAFRSKKQPSTSAHTLPGQHESNSQSTYHKNGQTISEIERHAKTHRPPVPTYRCSIGGCEYEGSHLEEERDAHVRTYHSHETDEAKIESRTESSIDREVSDDEATQSPESDDQTTMAYAKHQIIDRLMENFYAIFIPRGEAAV